MSDLPNLYIPGAMKSGTSSLWRYLNNHPDIFMSVIKEPCFWIDDHKFPDLESYKAHFKEGRNHLYRGDASTPYMTFDNFIERVKIYTPDAKFIFILRNPVDRAWSHYWYLKGIGYAQMPFKETFLKSIDAKPDFRQYTITREGQYYYSFGLYGKSLARFYEHFDQKNILILETSQLKKFPLETVNSCFRFLNISEVAEVEEQNLNPTVLLRNPDSYYKNQNYLYGNNPVKALLKKIVPKSFGQMIRRGVSKTLFTANKTDMTYPAMTPEERAWTASFYQEDIALLKQITGLSFQDWKDF